MTGSLEGYTWKRYRAKQHFEALEAALQQFLDTHPFGLVTELDPQGRQYLIKTIVHTEPPVALSALIGDCIFNLRSALDHLAWQLIIHNGQQPTERTEFPIFLESDRFSASDKTGKPVRGSGIQKMAGMPAGAQAVLAAAQPYNHNSAPELHPLWLLQRLSNEDKHRSLVMVGATMQEMASINAYTQNGKEVRLETVIAPQPFSDGSVVGHIDLVSTDSAIAKGSVTDVELVMMPRFNVAFAPEGPGKGQAVAPTLADIANTVSRIAIDLSDYLPSTPSIQIPDHWAFRISQMDDSASIG